MIKKKKILIYILLIMFPFLLEFVIASWNVKIVNAKDYGTSQFIANDFKYSQQDTEKGKKQYIYTLDIEKQYIDKIFIDFTFEEYSEFEVVFDAYNGYDIEEEMKLNVAIDGGLNTTFQKVGKKVDQIQIISNDNNFILNELSIVNTVVFNKYRFGLFLGISLVTFIVMQLCKKEKLKLEYVFICLSIVVGILYIVATPKVSHWSPDSEIHYNLAHTNSFVGHSVYNTNSTDMAVAAPSMSIPNTIEDNRLLNEYLNDEENNVVNGFSKKRLLTQFNQWAYYPSSFGIAIGRALNLPFTWIFSLGKLMNLLFYTVMGYFAIKMAKHGKRLFFTLALLPSAMFLMSQYSLDGIIYSCSLLGMSLYFTHFFDKEKKVTFWWSVAFVISICFASFAKAVYGVLILLPVFFNKNKFSNNKQCLWFKIGLILVFFGLLTSMLLPMLLSSAPTGDLRGGITDAPGQILSMLTHPLMFFDMFSNILIDSLGTHLLSYNLTSGFYYLGELSEIYSLILLVLILFLSIMDWQVVERIKIKHKFLITIVLCTIIMMIYGALYISFTPVGLNSVNGVQTRYFLPILILLLVLPVNTKIKNTFNDKKFNLWVIAIVASVAFISVYTKIILVYCN